MPLSASYLAYGMRVGDVEAHLQPGLPVHSQSVGSGPGYAVAARLTGVMPVSVQPRTSPRSS